MNLINELLKSRKPIEILKSDILISYIKGWGKGGQKVNTSHNCVQLTHIPTKIVIKSHKTRSREINEKDAYKKLTVKLDRVINGDACMDNIYRLKAQLKKKVKEQQRKKKAAREKEARIEKEKEARIDSNTKGSIDSSDQKVEERKLETDADTMSSLSQSKGK